MAVDGCHVVVEGQTAVGSSPINVFTWNICDSTKSTPYTTSCNGNVTSAADSCLHKMQIAGDNNIFMLLETSNSEVLWNGTSTVCIQGGGGCGGGVTTHGDAGLDLSG